VCGWPQVKLCDPLVTHGPYLSALAVVLLIIRRCTNNQITLTLTVMATYTFLMYSVRCTHGPMVALQCSLRLQLI